MSLTPTERRNALTATEANLLWLRIGSNYRRATELLCDGELQAAIIAAQNYAGVGPPTDGSIAYSDPTGMAAIRDAGTDLRAADVRRVWLRQLDEIIEGTERLRVITAEVYALAIPARTPSLATTIRTLRLLTLVPHNLAHDIARQAISADELAEYDHAVRHVHRCSEDLRSGSLTTSSGKRCPSVYGVLLAAQRVTEAAPPAPVQKPIGACTNCVRYGFHADAPAGGLCAPCVRFRSEVKALPRGLACREQDRKGLKARYTSAMIEEARAAFRSSVKPGRSRVS